MAEVKSTEETNGVLSFFDEKKKEQERNPWAKPMGVCENNFEDSGYCANGDETAFDQEVDVVGIEDGQNSVGGFEVTVKNDDPDATENSSSFGNTFSGSEDEVKVGDEEEVDSQFSMENKEQPISEGPGRLLKKKKVTQHWRNFISPLMWRCQWLELRMHELRSQAQVYDKQLAGYKREKQLQSKMIELDDSVSKSIPLTCLSRRRRAMKRRRRKRNEDAVDVSSYLSNHHIFSYYENKNETDGHSVDDACDDQVIEDIFKANEEPEWSTLVVRGGDDNSLEQLLLSLEHLQKRVRGLQTQLGSVSCHAENVLLQGDPPASYVQSRSLSPVNNHDSVPLHRGEDSAGSSYGDAADIDMIGCTAELFTGDARMPRGNDFFHDIPDDVLISNHAADNELKTFEKVSFGKDQLQEIVKQEESQSSSEDSKTPPSSLSVSAAAAGQSSQPQVPKKVAGRKRGRPKRNRRASGSGLRSERLKKRRSS